MSTTPAYQRVLDHVEESIITGALTIGDRLESERSIAERLQVSRASVREAIRALSILGVVKSSVGSGPQAGAVLVSDVELGSSSALRLHVATRAIRVGDIVRTRVMLESGSYREITEPVPEERLAAAELHLGAMDEAEDVSAFHHADLAFHLTLVQLADNAVANMLMASLRAAIENYVSTAMGRIEDWTATAQLLQEEHRELLAHLRAGEGEQAARVAERHILGFARLADLLG